jgi:hypothetical protein
MGSWRVFRTVRHWWQEGDGKTTARLFMFELVVVVAGVLIALGAEEQVSNWHWQGEVRDSDRRIREEIGHNLVNAYERLAINDCLEPRLAELRDELVKDQPRWAGSRARFATDIYGSAFPAVYRTPNRPWPNDAWETALNGEILSHFRPERVATFAALFDEVSGLQRSQSEELGLAASLGDLAFPGPISAAERRANLKLVAQLGALNARIVFQSRRVLKNAAVAGISPDSERLKENMDEQRRYRGTCVREPDMAMG